MKWPRRKHQRRPRFSIVMFTKNGMPFVRDAAASLEAQAFEDYELGRPRRRLDGRHARVPSGTATPQHAPGVRARYGSRRRVQPRVPTMQRRDRRNPRRGQSHPSERPGHRRRVVSRSSGRGCDLWLGEDDRRNSRQTDRVVRTSSVRSPGAHALRSFVPPMSTTFFDRRRCGPQLRGDTSLTAAQDFDLLLRLSGRQNRPHDRPARCDPRERQEHVRGTQTTTSGSVRRRSSRSSASSTIILASRRSVTPQWPGSTAGQPSPSSSFDGARATLRDLRRTRSRTLSWFHSAAMCPRQGGHDAWSERATRIAQPGSVDWDCGSVAMSQVQLLAGSTAARRRVRRMVVEPARRREHVDRRLAPLSRDRR